jgi:hypothetical protein
MGFPHRKRAIDLSQPMRGYHSSEARLLTATPNGYYVMEIVKKDGTFNVYTVDKMGCDINTGHQKVWNTVHFEPSRFDIGQTIYSLRLGRKLTRSVIKGTVKRVEKTRYLVQIPGQKNFGRDDGLFVIGFGSAYGSLSDIENRIEDLLTDFHRMRDAEKNVRIKKTAAVAADEATA